MDTFECKRCNTSHRIYNQDSLNVSGVVEIQQMDPISRDAEIVTIDENTEYVYYYFDKHVLKRIRTNGNAAAFPRELCPKCINESITNTFIEKDPHYGDGIYITLNGSLRGSSQQVKYAHGEQVSNRNYRAKFKIQDYKHFKKILKTGGIGKTVEKMWHKEKFFMNQEPRGTIAILKAIEKYEDGHWVGI